MEQVDWKDFLVTNYNQLKDFSSKTQWLSKKIPYIEKVCGFHLITDYRISSSSELLNDFSGASMVLQFTFFLNE